MSETSRTSGNNSQAHVKSCGETESKGALISENCVSVLHLLLEASLFPKLFSSRLKRLPTIEQDEGLDALSFRGALWIHLITEWALDQEQIDLVSVLRPGERGHTIDAQGFYEALGEIQLLFEIEFSVPLRPMGHSGPIDPEQWAGRKFLPLAPFPGQRVHLVERSDWIQFPFYQTLKEENSSDGLITEEFNEDVVNEDSLPVFGESSLQPQATWQVGQYWVRISEASLAELQADLPSAITTYCIVAERRLQRVREMMHRQQSPLSQSEVQRINQMLRNLSDLYHTISDGIEKIQKVQDPIQQRALMEGFVRALNSDTSTDKSGSSGSEASTNHSPDPAEKPKTDKGKPSSSTLVRTDKTSFPASGFPDQSSVGSSWWMPVSVFFIGALAIFLSLALPDDPGLLPGVWPKWPRVSLAGGGVALLIYFRSQHWSKHRYLYACLSTIAGLISINAVPSLMALYKDSSGRLAQLEVQGPHWSINCILGLLCVCFLILEFRHDKTS